MNDAGENSSICIDRYGTFLNKVNDVALSVE